MNLMFEYKKTSFGGDPSRSNLTPNLKKSRTVDCQIRNSKMFAKLKLFVKFVEFFEFLLIGDT
jgi:hypothetical protein